MALSETRKGPRVVLLCGHGTQTDEHVPTLLESELAKNGYSVFVDRQIENGMEWAREVERQIRLADAVISLLSIASSVSETLVRELQIAHEAAERQNGRPRLLLVRINFDDNLPDSLGNILGPRECFSWKGPQDDGRLVAELFESLRDPSAVKIGPKTLWQPSEAAQLDSEFYVVRDADLEFINAIKRRDSLVLVRGVSQVGKTSLITRGALFARSRGFAVALTEFQKFDRTHFKSLDAFLLSLGKMLRDQLNLSTSPEEIWNPRRDAGNNFERYLRREILKSLDRPLVWVLGDIDGLPGYDFGSEVFKIFRLWHNERTVIPNSPLLNLTLAMSCVTEPRLFIADPNQSPFNVGTKLEVGDFTFEQVAELNRRYGMPLQNDSEVTRFHRLLGGHPYLVQRALYEMIERGMSLTELEAAAARDGGLFGDHIRRLLLLLAPKPELSSMVRSVLRGQPVTDAEDFHYLRGVGLLQGDSPEDAALRCQLYADHLKRHLL